MSQKALKKEFHLDIDDLVDELLSALRNNNWQLNKMQYELASLHAQQKQKLKHGEKNVDVRFDLIAKWKDCGDGVELEILVEEPEHDWTGKDCAAHCTAIMEAMPDEKSYDTLYAQQPDFIYEDFESNN